MVVACAVMSAPLIIRTSRIAFEGVNARYEALARTLGFGPVETFMRFTLPLAARGLLAAVPRTPGRGDGGRLPVGLAGDPPSPASPPPGCPFHTRCEERLERCDRDEPRSEPVAGGWARCWLRA